jgi:hypothetical protein
MADYLTAHTQPRRYWPAAVAFYWPLAPAGSVTFRAVTAVPPDPPSPAGWPRRAYRVPKERE